MKYYISLVRRLITYYIIWPLSFLIGCKQPVDKKLAVFAYNKNYSSLPDNLRFVKKEFERAGWNCVEYGSPRDPKERFKSDIEFQKLYARSAVVFLSDNFDPVCAHKPRKGSKVVQLWHACGAFKKFGYSTLDSDWGGDRREWELFPRHNTYTDVFVSSEKVIPCYSEAFRCGENLIKPLGVPRTDIFFNSDFVKGGRNRMRAAIPGIGKRRIILYAPTFRGNNPDDAYNDNNIDFEKFRSLSKKCVIVLKYHPFTARRKIFTEEQEELFGDFVYVCPENITIDTAICAADIVVTDYSSLVFECALINKPMIFFAYDLKDYRVSRNYYFRYEDFVPGPIVKTDDELLEAILGGIDIRGINAFKEEYMSACDGRSSRRIAQYVISELEKNHQE